MILERIRQNRKVFETLVWPELQKVLGGDILPVEGERGALAKHLDRTAGLDALHVGERGVRGLANRIQFGEHPPGFTMRYAYWHRGRKVEVEDCEYQRRLAALRQGAEGTLYPHLSIYAKVRGSGRRQSLEYSLCIETKKLLHFIERNVDDERRVERKFNPKGGTRFFFVPLAAIQDECEVIRIPGPAPEPLPQAAP